MTLSAPNPPHRAERDGSAVLLRCEALLARPIDALSASESLGALARLHQAQTQTPSGEHILDGTQLSGDPHTVSDVAALKAEIDHTLLSARRGVVHDFLRRLDGIVADLAALDTSLTDMHGEVLAAQRQTRTAASLCAPLLSSAVPDQREVMKAQTEKVLAQLFTRRFSLPPHLAAALDHADVRVDEDTFAALDRLGRIRTEAQSLLTGGHVSGLHQGGGIRAGVDVMDTASAQLDRALHRIVQWMLIRIRDPDLPLQLDTSASGGNYLPRAVAYLHRENKKDLLRPALSELTDRRGKVVLESFERDLRFGSGPGERPIEAQAHDPLRYVGDILAWIHQAAAEERELCSSLMHLPGSADVPSTSKLQQSNRHRIGTRRHGIDSGSVDLTRSTAQLAAEDVSGMIHGTGPAMSAAEQAVSEMVNQALAPLARPLRERVLSVLSPPQKNSTSAGLDALLLLRLAHILDFYRVTFRRTLGRVEHSPLVWAVQDVARRADSAFDAALNFRAAQVRDADTPSISTAVDLRCPALIESEVAAFRKLLETALAAAQLDPDKNDGTLDEQARHTAQAQVAAIVTQLVGAMEAFCDRAAADIVAVPVLTRPASSSRQVSGVTNAGMGEERFNQGIFLVNCYSAILSSLRTASSLFPSAPIDTTVKRLEGQVNTVLEALTATYTQRLLGQMALGPLSRAIATLDDSASRPGEKAAALLTGQPGCDRNSIESSMHVLGDVLRSGAPLETGQLAPLMDPLKRTSVHQTALARAAKVYERIADYLRRPNRDGPPLEVLVELEPRDVRLLLGVAEEPDTSGSTR